MNERNNLGQVSRIFSNLKNKPDNFEAGKISHYYDKWQTLTKDSLILNIVQYGYEIEFITEPCKKCNRLPVKFNQKEQEIVSSLLQKFEYKGIIMESNMNQEKLYHIYLLGLNQMDRTD